MRRKMIMSVLANPLTVLPFGLGTTVLLGLWAVDARPDIGLMACILGALGSLGIFMTQLIFGSESKAKEALDETIEETRRESNRKLDELEQQLELDGDLRTEAALKDLRSLATALGKTSEGAKDGYQSAMMVSIRSDAAQLFRQCVYSLERSLSLWETAEEMLTDAAREPILQQRERLLDDVLASIEYMGKLLVSMQELSTGDARESELSRIRKELDESLAVAKRVEERYQDFESELETKTRI